tara:strand:+ start:180 stop:422 length:243 start_codon:yes stop_codon:yes gene_type:complete
MAETTEEDKNPELVTIFIKKPVKSELLKWITNKVHQVRLIDIGEEAVGINFDYADLLIITNKLEDRKLTPNKDFMVISNG